MTTIMEMEEDQIYMTERILNLTLEIIYLLTGESFPPVKPGDHVTIAVPQSHYLTHGNKSKKKILEVTKKMMELLTGESYNKAELKEEIKEEDRVMVESSSYRKPAERCPRPLYSPRDPTQEDLTISHHHQIGNLGDYNIVIKEEYKEEDEEYGVMEELLEGHKDVKEPPSKKRPLERCLRPLYSHRDPTQEDHAIHHHHHHHQGEDAMDIKGEGEVEETYVRDDQQYTEEEEEAGMTRTFIEEDTPTQISTGCKMEDEDMTGEKATSSHNVDRTWTPSGSEQPRTVPDGAGIQREKKFSCLECGEGFSTELSLAVHQRSHTGEELHPCADCGKCFSSKSDLVTHQISHTGGKLYKCAKCGECFALISAFVLHQRTHTGKKQYTCSECGKCFAKRYHLDSHQRLHTGEKPYLCSECGKCFSHKSNLTTHQRSHRGEKPYSCPECGKRYTRRTELGTHLRSHRGEKPHSCPQCTKCFLRKSDLVKHLRSHTGEKPYACHECGKSFSQKFCLTLHQRNAHNPQAVVVSQMHQMSSS